MRVPAIRATLVHAMVLGAFSMTAAGLLVGGNLLTADAIRQRAKEDLQASLAQVLPPSLHDNDLLADVDSVRRSDGPPVTVYRAKKDGHVTAVAYETAGAGYAGEIRVVMGVDADGRLLGVRVVKHAETPGLGDKVEPAKSDWITRFTGRSLGDPPVERWQVKKDGGDFDQFSGATVTPRAVVGAIRDGLTFFAANRDRLLEVSR